MKLTLPVLLLAVALTQTSAFSIAGLKDKLKGVKNAVNEHSGNLAEKAKNAFSANKDKVQDILGKVKAEAKNFLNGTSDGDIADKLQAAAEKAMGMIKNAQNMTEEEKKQALEKGRAYFEDIAKNKLGKVQQVVEAAKKKAGAFMEEHNPDLNLKENFEAAVQKAKDFIESQNLTEEEKKEALEKGKKFFMTMRKKLPGRRQPGNGSKRPGKGSRMPGKGVNKPGKGKGIDRPKQLKRPARGFKLPKMPKVNFDLPEFKLPEQGEDFLAKIKEQEGTIKAALEAAREKAAKKLAEAKEAAKKRLSATAGTEEKKKAVEKAKAAAQAAKTEAKEKIAQAKANNAWKA